MKPNASQSLLVVYRSINTLTPIRHNARTHSARQIRQIAQSIQEFSFTNPILIDGDGGVIAGHGRLAAAKLLGIEQVPVIQIDGLTRDQIRAYIIADNRLAEKAGWDQEILAIELQHLISINATFDVTITGFEVPEIDLILEPNGGAPDNDDVVPLEPSGPKVTKPGDLWQLGKHRLHCGNALSEDAYLTLLGSKRAAVVFADPPFNIRIEGNVSGKGAVKHGNFAMGNGEMKEAEFSQFLKKSLTLLAKYSLPGAIHYIAMDWRHMGELLATGKEVYSSLLNLCIWEKDQAGQGSFYRSQHELFFVFRNGKGPLRNNIQLGKYGRNRSNVWAYECARTFSRNGDEGNLLALHPTVKPIALVADAILDVSKRGEIVIDPFLGSGTTLIAAERTGRVCYGMELDPKYVDVAIRRWQRHTGADAVLAASGKTFNELAQGGVGEYA